MNRRFVPKSWCYLPPDSATAAETAQTADEPEGPSLPPTLDLLLHDTVQFRLNNEAIEFPSAAGSWL